MAAETELERMVVRLMGDGTSYRRMLTDAQRASTAAAAQVERAGRRMEAIQRRLLAVGSAMRTAGRNMMRVGRSMTMYVTAPIIGAAAAVTKLGSDFESEMSRIVGLVGVAQEQVDAWSEDILRIAPALGKSPKELAQAMFFVTSAGFRGAAAMDVLTQSAKASTGGLGETKVVADAVTSAVNAYGAANLSAGRATDVLVAAVREGKLEAEALAPVIGRLLPMASKLGVEFHEVAGAIAVMSRTGMEAAQSATAIRSLFLALHKPTADGVKLLESAGLSYKMLRDMLAKPGGTIDALRLIEERFRGNDTAIVDIVPNLRALGGVFNVLAQDASIVDKVMAGVADATGSTEKAFKTATDTIKFKFNAALAELKANLSEINQELTPILIPAVDKLRDGLEALMNVWRGLSPEMRRAAIIAAAVAAAIGPMLLITGILTQLIGFAASGIGLLIGSLGFLLHPVTLAVAGVAALAAGLVILQRQYGTFDPLINAAHELYIQLYDRLLPVCKSLWKEIQHRLIPVMIELGHETIDAMGKMVEAIEPLIPLLETEFLGALESIAFFMERVLIPQVKTLTTLLEALERTRPLLEAMGFAAAGKPRMAGGTLHGGREQRAGLLGAAPARGVAGTGDAWVIAEMTRRSGEALQRQQAAFAASTARALEVRKRWQEARAAVAKLTTNLREQVDVFGMSASQLDLYRAKLAGATRAELRHIEALHGSLDAAKKQQDMMARGQQLIDEYMTPLERFSKMHLDLEQLLAMEVIDLGTFTQAMKAAREELERSGVAQARGAFMQLEAVQAGTARGYARLAEYIAMRPGMAGVPEARMQHVQASDRDYRTWERIGLGIERLIELGEEQLEKEPGLTLEAMELT